MESPENWLIKLYQAETDSVKWRFLLNFLGVESTPLHKQIELNQALLHDPPGLIIVDRALLGEVLPAIESSCLSWIERGGGIALTGHDGLTLIPGFLLAKMTDISERDPFTINTLLQCFIPTYSRCYPRIGVRLPGLYARAAGSCQICEIMNLSHGGAFIRTTEALPLSGEQLRVNVPLIGLRKEIELSGQVVRQILPNEANNFAQGIGVSFMGEENASALSELNDYVRYVLAHDEALDPQVTPFSGCQTRRKNINVNLLPPRPVKGRERSLNAIR